MNLVKEIKDNFPLTVYATDRLSKMLRNQGLWINKGDKLQVDEVMDAGFEGGIMCMIPIKDGKKLISVSITHVKIDDNFPLKEKINEYQKDRIKFLKESN